MYIKPTYTYYKGSQFYAARAKFLVLLHIRDDHQLYGVVRKVAMAQLGNFMMGRANLNGHWITVSGAYGNDGLPLTVDTLPKDAKLIPPDLQEAWNKGGGWNNAGSEAPLMREWALSNF